ncbi:MAG: PCRF domain-containing protein, partial [Acidimicrobiales bacterium]
MRDFSDDIKGLVARLADAEEYLRIAELRAKQPQLETEASRPDLWDDPDAARQVTGELSAVNSDIELYDGLAQRLADAEVLAEMAREESDESQEPEIVENLATVAKTLDELELRSLFAGEHDERDALCSLSSGEGGADAQDWTEMLLRMYLRWAESHGFDVELDDSTPGSEAGLSSAEFV